MVSVTIDLERTTCWCGTIFMIPAPLLKQAHNCAHPIYCPHGHKMVWEETEADRMRRERDSLKQAQARLEEEKRIAWATANEQAERAKKAEAANKRLKKRASAGTCPCCNRSFANMAQHMKHQHPEVLTEGGTKVVPLKRPGAAH